jgi:hypothetical protein
LYCPTSLVELLHLVLLVCFSICLDSGSLLHGLLVLWLACVPGR